MKKDKELREKMAEIFADLEAEPQIQSWENIQNVIQKPKKQKKFFWFLFLILGGFLLGIGSYLAFYGNKNLKKEESQQLAARKIEKPYEKTGEETDKKPNSSAEIKKELILAQNQPTKAEQKTLSFAVSSKNISPKKDTQMLPLSPIIRLGEQKALQNAFSQDSTHNSQTIDNKSFNTKDLKQFDSLFALLPIQKENFLLSQDFHLPPLNTSPISIFGCISASKRSFLSAEISMLSAFQLMQTQQNQLHSVGKVALLPTFSAKRLGVSAALYYNRKLNAKNSVFAGINGFLLPYNMEYELQENNVYKVKFAQNGSFSIENQSVPYKERYFSYNLGVELGYERSFSWKNKDFSFFVSGITNKTLHQTNLNYWVKSGVKVPLNANLSILPVFQYQLNRTLDANALMKMRLYTLGVGVHYKWKN
jgi:hypothetical protein